MKNLIDEIVKLDECIKNYEVIANELGGKSLKSDKSFKQNAKIEKLSKTLDKSYNYILKQLSGNSNDKNSWCVSGIDFIETDNKCPFCDKRISKRKISRMNKIRKIDNKSFLFFELTKKAF